MDEGAEIQRALLDEAEEYIASQEYAKRWSVEELVARRHAARWTEDGHDVAIELGQGDVAAIVLGLSEKSTAAQRALAREVVRGWVGQAFGQLADQLGFRSE
jgi:hypothetical protein